MRRPYALGVCALAVALGSLTGAYALPAGGAGGPQAPSVTSSSSAAPSGVAPPSPSTSPSPSPSTTPSPTPSPSATKALSESDLLSVRSFADQSVSVTSFPQGGKADPAADATLCVSDDVHEGRRTLRQLTGHDPVLQGYWTQTGSGYATGQVVADAADAADAARSVADLAAAQKPCLEADPGHWVLGPARTEDFSSTRSATWFGYFPDEQNTSGRAPDDVEPCGGTLLARNGARFSVVNVRMCLDEAQLTGLAAAASERLG